MGKKIQRILDIIFNDVSSFGGSVFYALVVLFLLIFGKMNVALQLIVSFLIIILISFAIKLIFFKNRPKKQKFTNVVEKIDAGSFPSVHSARATSLTFIILSNIPRLELFLTLIPLALLVCYSRIFIKKHFLLDVVGGIVLGVITSFIAILLL